MKQCDQRQLGSSCLTKFRLDSICPMSGPLRDGLTYVSLSLGQNINWLRIILNSYFESSPDKSHTRALRLLAYIFSVTLNIDKQFKS